MTKALRAMRASSSCATLRPARSTVSGLAAPAEAFQAQRGAQPPGKVIISVGRATE